MKKSICFLALLLVCFVMMSCNQDNGCNNSYAATQQYDLHEFFENHLKTNGIEGDIWSFTPNDYQKNDNKQAFALVGNEQTSELWYTDGTTTECLLSKITVDGLPTVVETSSKPIYIIDIKDGEQNKSYAYIVTEGKPLSLVGSGEKLTHMGNDDFCTFVLCDDHKLSDGQQAGETRKKYYLYFDGTGFKEYGGIYITKDEFLRLNKSDAILNNISDCGYTVTNIIWRDNGIININCEKQTEEVTVYENLTVKVIKNNCICIPSGQAQDADYVGRSTYSGIYKIAAFPDIATYPESFKSE